MDIVQIPVEPDLNYRSGIVAGVSVIEGRQYELIDSFALFGAVPEDATAPRRIRCLLADKDDPWMQEILAPLIRQAGYEAVLSEEASAEDADVVLCLAQSEAASILKDRPVVRLRHAQRPEGPEDSSIYRYDRDALIAAIESARNAQKGRAA